MARIHYCNIDKIAQENSEGVAFGGLDISETLLSVLIENYNPPNYIGFDGLGIDLLNNDLNFLKNGDFVGYIAGPSDDSCNLNGASLYFTLRQSYNQFTLSGITLSFYGDCCREIVVLYYDEDTNLIGEETININDYFFNWQPILTSCSSFRIIFTKTALPNQFLKLFSIKFGTATVFKKFKNIELIEEINILSEDLPMNALNFSVCIEEPIDFVSGNPMNVYNNNRYYGTFYLDESKRVSKNIYDINTYNKIGILETESYDGWQQGAFNLNGILSVIEEKTNSVISFENRSGYLVSGDFKEPNCRIILCSVGFSVGKMVNASRSPYISLIPIPTEVTSVILSDSKRIIGKATFNRSEDISNAVVEYTGVSDIRVGGAALYETKEINITPNVCNVYTFDSPVYVIDVKTNGVSCDILYQDLYSVWFKPNISSETAVVEYNPSRIWVTSESVTNENSESKKTLKFNKLPVKAWNAKDLPVKDELFEPIAVANISRAADVKKYIVSRGYVSAKIRLRNERVGDLISIETEFDGIITGIITSMNIHFGYEDTADIEVFEWQTG